MFDRALVYGDYTAKLVKTLLVGVLGPGHPVARLLAGESRRAETKEVHVTPLYRRRPGGGVEALYPRSRGPGEPAGAVELRPGVEYFFYLGLGPAHLSAVTQLALHGAARVPARTGGGGARVEVVEAALEAEYSPQAGPLVEPRPGATVKVVLSSPTLPTSPYHHGTRLRRLTTAPTHLLAVNAQALYRRPDPRVLAALDLLAPAPASTRTVKTTWYLYGGNLLPALTGYIKYTVDPYAASDDALETLAHTLSHAAVMGAGASRAAGFGHLKITTEEKQ